MLKSGASLLLLVVCLSFLGGSSAQDLVFNASAILEAVGAVQLRVDAEPYHAIIHLAFRANDVIMGSHFARSAHRLSSPALQPIALGTDIFGVNSTTQTLNVTLSAVFCDQNGENCGNETLNGVPAATLLACGNAVTEDLTYSSGECGRTGRTCLFVPLQFFKLALLRWLNARVHYMMHVAGISLFALRNQHLLLCVRRATVWHSDCDH